MTKECPLKHLTKNWSRWWSIRPLFNASLIVRRLIGEEDARLNAVNLLELKSGQKVLELGCGLGANLRRLQATGAQVTAVDASMENVTAARSEIRANNLMNIKVLTLEEAKDLEPESFDAVLCSNTFTSSPRPDIMMYFACRWLKKGGKIAAADYIPSVEENPVFIPFALPMYAVTGSSPNVDWRMGLKMFADTIFEETFQGGLSALVFAQKRENGSVPEPKLRTEIEACPPRESKKTAPKQEIKEETASAAPETKSEENKAQDTENSKNFP